MFLYNSVDMVTAHRTPLDIEGRPAAPEIMGAAAAALPPPLDLFFLVATIFR